jgi:hypothetical protein
MEQYLDLLAKSVTGTLYDREPDHDNPDQSAFVRAFTMHYMRGTAITMLPRVRLDNIRHCIRLILNDGIPGDLIEAGVWRGGGAIYMRACLNIFGGSNRILWVADSFEGLPEPDPNNKKEHDFYHSRLMQQHYAKMAASYDEVIRNFEAYSLLPQVRFLKGLFKDTLPHAPIGALSVIRLDGDYYTSTMDCLISLYPKLSEGGIIIIDDYGEDMWTDCRAAVDSFRQLHDIRSPMIPVDSKCAFWRKDTV